MSLQLTIESAFIPYSRQKIGNGQIELMRHQQELREANERLIIVDAPTSSGKTLAMITKIIDSGGHAVFVYPTNELIRDQGRSIAELIRRAGRRPVIVPMEDEVEEGAEKGDVIIATVSGDALEGVARKGDAIQKILHHTSHGRELILLTNIDTLYLLFQMRYGGRYRGRSLLSDFLHTQWDILAIDEMHMYTGVALSNLIYLIWLLKDRFGQVLLSSATHHDAVNVLRELISDCRIIRPPLRHGSEVDAMEDATCSPADETSDLACHQIRYRVQLELRPYKRNLGDRERDEILQYVNRFIDSGVQKILIIVNSVIFSEMLADALEERYGAERVGRINGMIPQRFRAQKEITVGTSAIEVGVDFDVDALIFQGSDAASFLQRFGRVGRHREGIAIGYIPDESYRLVSKRIHKRGSASFNISQLSELVIRCIPMLEHYVEFSRSVYGAALFLSLLQRIGEAGMRLDLEDLEKKYTDLRPPIISDHSFDSVNKIAPKSVREIISRGGARGDILTVPVFLERYQCFSRMDIFELLKTEFEYRDLNTIRKERPPWLQSNERIPVVTDIRSRAARVKGSWTGLLQNTKTKRLLYADTENLNIMLDDNDLSRAANRLFHEKIVHPTSTNHIRDWRFPVIYNAMGENTCLVVGLEALVQKFIDGLRS